MRILFLSRWFPYPDDNGSKKRVYNLLRQLSAVHEVHLLSFEDRPGLATPEAMAHLEGILTSVLSIPYQSFRPMRFAALRGLLRSYPRFLIDTFSEAMFKAVQESVKARQIELVIASQVDMLPYLDAAPGTPSILEELEISTQLDAAAGRSNQRNRLLARLTWWKLAAYLRRTVPRCQGCTVASEEEARRVAALLPGYGRIRVVPNAVDPALYEDSYGPPERNSMVFAGALTYSANLDGAKFLAKEVLPALAQVSPDARVRVTGDTKGLRPEAIPRHPNLQLTGYVTDVRPIVARSWLAVVPLRIGGGTRLKILEAMALGTPVVATRKGAEGLAVRHGENILLADSAGEIVTEISRLLSSDSLRKRLSDGGRRLIREKYTWEVAGAPLLELVSTVPR